MASSALGPLERVTSRLVDARTELARHEAYCLRTAQRSSDRHEVWSRSLPHDNGSGRSVPCGRCLWLCQVLVGRTKASVPPYQAVCSSLAWREQ